MTQPQERHVLCGTCVGEFKRKCGYFESRSRREEVLDMTSVPVTEDQQYEYCCNCGQGSWPAATYQLKPGSQACDGEHRPYEEE